ncbi:hypothetical protein OB905_13330 [Halobacteria archaeon AArc-dxtr1]|nr:hypothetical protein [Halobacteria archaeon AArc-dxtr1]
MPESTQRGQQGESQVQRYDERQVEQQRSLPVKQGAAFGAVAAVATYLAHLLLTIVATAQASPTPDSDGNPVSLVASWEAAGWSYLSTFGVGFGADGETATVGDAPNHAAAFAAPPISLGTLVLFTVSVGAIVAAGYAIAKYSDPDDSVEAVKAGLTTVPAYLVFAIVIAVVMTHTYEDVLAAGLVDSVAGLDAADYEEGDTVSFGASTTSAALYAGLLFPAVFAVAGALLTEWRDARDRVLAKVA